MVKRQTIGANPLDVMVPPAPSPSPELAQEDRKAAKERCTFHIPVDLMERARNCVFWTPGLTMGGLAEEGIKKALDAYEKKNGGPFQHRKSNLKGGRPAR
jgi:hypothetical protein